MNSAVGDEDYKLLATFRHALRRFVAFSEQAARASGLAPRQHQALLAIKGHPGKNMSIGELAEQLLIRPHSAVELVGRLVDAGLVTRREDAEDRRRVYIDLTEKAENVLEQPSSSHLAELKRMRPLLSDLLRRLSTPASG